MHPAQQRLIAHGFQAIGTADGLQIKPEAGPVIGQSLSDALAEFRRRMGKIKPRRRPIALTAKPVAHAHALNRLRAH